MNHQNHHPTLSIYRQNGLVTYGFVGHKGTIYNISPVSPDPETSEQVLDEIQAEIYEHETEGTVTGPDGLAYTWDIAYGPEYEPEYDGCY